MAKLKATPKNFAEALQFILAEGKGKLSLRIGNNTYLEYHTGHGTAMTENITVRLHHTHVVTFWPSGRITLHTGGYRTVTTKDRINKFIAGRVHQDQGKWYYTTFTPEFKIASQQVFEEGMAV